MPLHMIAGAGTLGGAAPSFECEWREGVMMGKASKVCPRPEGAPRPAPSPVRRRGSCCRTRGRLSASLQHLAVPAAAGSRPMPPLTRRDAAPGVVPAVRRQERPAACGRGGPLVPGARPPPARQRRASTRGARGRAGRRGGTLDGAGAPTWGLPGNPELTCNGSNGRYINTLNQPTGSLPRPEAQRRYDLSAGGRRYEFLPDRGGYNPVLDPPFQCSPLPHPESPPPPWTPSLPTQEYGAL
jgi:hypothetical protein